MFSSFTDAVDFLDGVRPKWWEVIDVTILEMTSHSRCILGQLYGDYRTARREIGNPHSDECLISNYFCSNDYLPQWINTVNARKAAALLCPSNANIVLGVPITVKLSDGSLMNVLNIKDVPVGVAFTIHE